MSAVLYSVSGNNASLQGTTVGGTKPLHRFIKGQPKIIGVIVLIIGSSLFIISVSGVNPMTDLFLSEVSSSILLGLLFIMCGILYILTEHHPSKKTVTISLALSIVTILWSGWTILCIMPMMINHLHDRYEYFEDNTTGNEDHAWHTYHEAMIVSMEVVFMLYCFAGAIIFIVMSIMAGIALRSTKSQAMVVMTAAPTETQDEQQAEEEGLNCEKMDE
ncbi:uncharacterized protein LOC117809235 [Notolabrus celidotus]|uniref:uncharacterized protein LOC117809235 n=1 Tax=Notolabrus celidotus TaxID=1203425 RepID=UPI00148F907E|nr:uncharacterized protein LOC117809235 [Notolabrus celidotus]